MLAGLCQSCAKLLVSKPILVLILKFSENIDIESILNSKWPWKGYWYRYWFRNSHGKNIDIDIDFEIDMAGISILISISKLWKIEILTLKLPKKLIFLAPDGIFKIPYVVKYRFQYRKYRYWYRYWFEIDIFWILILVLISKWTFSQYRYWYWFRNRHSFNIDIDIGFEISQF